MTANSTSTVLIANRGEIAVRIARAARDLGIRSVAVYSQADVDALHTRVSDEAWALPGSTAAESYLNIPALLDVAARAGADCVHPGYGFLSENSGFARAVAEAGMTWIGPTPESIDTLGDKMAARQLAESVGAPLAPGTSEPLTSWEQAHDFAEEHGLPVVIKAAFGGGGRGLKIVTEADGTGAIEGAFASAGRESREAFGRTECFVEKFLDKPRHVEAQVLADTHGTVAVVGTRDCSTQRRFQKLVEEAPAPFLTSEQDRLIRDGARDICSAAGYVGAGTVEFIVSGDSVSFLEVNTRVQVEHPVTEATTGVDIVAEQFRIAAGEELSPAVLAADRGGAAASTGHAFEFRINAEDVGNGFAPCPGTVTSFEVPTGPGIRVDAGVRSGSTVPGYYDSLLGKLIVWGPDRPTALRRAVAALDEFRISGVRSVLPFHRDIVREPAFAAGDGSSADEFGMYTDWVDNNYVPGAASGTENIKDACVDRSEISVEIDGRLHTVGLPASLLAQASGSAAAGDAAGNGAASGGGNNAGDVLSPFAGTLVEWKVDDGATVSAGDTVAIVEAMKMERTVTAPVEGTLSVAVETGTPVSAKMLLGTIR